MFKPETPILIVDDMGTMRKLVKKACSDLGFATVTEAADGALAWEALGSANGRVGRAERLPGQGAVGGLGDRGETKVRAGLFYQLSHGSHIVDDQDGGFGLEHTL